MRNTRILTLGIIVLVFMVAFIVSVWNPFTPRIMSPKDQPTACWQPDSPIAQFDPKTAVYSDFLPINDGIDALSWRLALIESAQERIDVQYFMWHMDEVGLLILERLLSAADRGVKVRILLDDLMGGLDREWLLASAHENVEVRLFNPFRTRDDNWLARGPEWLINISRLNRRMHNKLFLVDQKIGIMGGRNISNEYFGLGSHLDFRDFDLLVSGPVSYQLDESFETFWHSTWTYAPKKITEQRKNQNDLDVFRETTRQWLSKAEKIAYLQDLGYNWEDKLTEARKRFIHASAKVIYDCPPGTKSDKPVQRVIVSFRDLLHVTDKKILLVSPYVVLPDSIREHLFDAMERNVTVQLLTNSLAAADQNITFSAYAKSRNTLLSNGINIYEMKADGEHWDNYRTPLSSGEYLSVHAKIVLLDDDKVMVGSPNLDPRSKLLNSEIALLIRSKELSQRISEHFKRDLQAENSWQVRLDDAGKMYWEAGDEKYYKEPARSTLQRLQVFFFSLFPIDDQL